MTDQLTPASVGLINNLSEDVYLSVFLSCQNV